MVVNLMTYIADGAEFSTKSMDVNFPFVIILVMAITIKFLCPSVEVLGLVFSDMFLLQDYSERGLKSPDCSL